MRAPARLGIFVVFFLAILAAYGHAAIADALPRRGRTALAFLVCGGLMLEYWVAPVSPIRYANAPPPLYAWLAAQPRGLVVEFPIPLQDTLPGDEARYTYMSTFHWMPMMNGYSRYYPPSYLSRTVGLQHFPDSSSTDLLRRAGVAYVVMHVGSYPSDQVRSVLRAMSIDPAYAERGHFHDGRGDAVVFRIR